MRRAKDVGQPAIGLKDSTDCRLSQDWRAFRAAEALFEAWSPPQASPWSAYHRPTLFAALDNVREAWPQPVDGLDARAAPLRAPEWARREHAILLDLPGEVSVAYAAWLAKTSGHEPVVTFNNWPHAKAVLDMWRPLTALLHFAPWVVEAKRERAASGAAGAAGPGETRPPVLVLDNRRLLHKPPPPGRFDNRYYLMESDLPSAALLKRHGIERVVYVRAGRTPDGVSLAAVEVDDLNPYLVTVAKSMGVDVAGADTHEWETYAAGEYRPATRKTPFNTTRDPAFSGFRRSAAGGFGELVPEPSSGGG